MGGAVETSTPSQSVPSEPTASNDPFEHEERFLLSARRGAPFPRRDRPRGRPSRSTIAPGRSPIRERPIFDTDDFAYFRSVRRAARAAAAGPRVRDGGLARGRAGALGHRVRRAQAERGHRAVARCGSPPHPPSSRGCSTERDGGPATRHRRARAAADARDHRAGAAPTMAPRLTTWYRRACLTGGGGPRAHHARRAPDLLPAAADRRRRRRWRRRAERT